MAYSRLLAELAESDPEPFIEPAVMLSPPAPIFDRCDICQKYVPGVSWHVDPETLEHTCGPADGT